MFLSKKSAKLLRQQEQMSPDALRYKREVLTCLLLSGFAEPLRRIQVQSLRLLCLLTCRFGTSRSSFKS